MPEVSAIKTVMTGYTGAPGYATHYFWGDPINSAAVTEQAAAVRTFWQAIRTLHPTGWAASVQTDVSILDEATGALQRILTATDPGTVTNPAGVATYAAGVGACATWGTAGVHGARRLRGRTFIVPLGTDQYQSDGTIVSSSLTTLRDAATALGAYAAFGVWGRPRDAYTDEHGSHPALVGDWSACTGASVRDKVAMLRSRRD